MENSTNEYESTKINDNYNKRVQTNTNGDQLVHINNN